MYGKMCDSWQQVTLTWLSHVISFLMWFFRALTVIVFQSPSPSLSLFMVVYILACGIILLSCFTFTTLCFPWLKKDIDMPPLSSMLSFISIHFLLTPSYPPTSCCHIIMLISHAGEMLLCCNMKFRTSNQNLHSFLLSSPTLKPQLSPLKGGYVNFGLVF